MAQCTACAPSTDWIDVEGRARHYFYVDTAFVAIIAGVADANQTAALLEHYDSRLAEIYTTLNVTPGSIWVRCSAVLAPAHSHD